ncbi:MAG: hypothetical protein EA400_00310, partial [Chromatiaceae bacterium]
MLTLDEALTIENQDAPDEAAHYATLQRAINEGAWTFQGSCGRAMMAAIEGGHCLLGHRGFQDAYGSPFKVSPQSRLPLAPRVS